MDCLRTIRLRLVELNVTVVLCLLFLVSFLVSACTRESSEQFTISVEYRQIQLNADKFEDETDYSSATVSIKRVDVNESNEESLSELITSPFRNGKVELRRPIEHPIWVEVLVETVTDKQPLKLRTFIEPGEAVSVAVVDSAHSRIDDTIAHVGSVSNVQDPNKKFSLSADLNPSDVDFLDAIALLQTNFWNEQGELEQKTIYAVVVQDGQVNVEIEVEDPVILSVYILGPSNLYADLIAEAGTSIRLEPSRQTAETSESLTTGWFQTRDNISQRLHQNQSLIAIADRGRHKRLFESWQRSFTYRLMRKRLAAAYVEQSIRSMELAVMRPSLEETSEIQSEENLPDLANASWVKTDPAKGCEHVDLSQVLPDRAFLWMTSPRDSLDTQVDELHEESYNIRYMILNDIARRAKDPFDSLLALELYALISPEERKEAINILDRLSQSVSPLVAEGRVAPIRRYTSALIESEENEQFTVPGQKAPDFELLDLQESSQKLSQVLKENDLVFLEFVSDPDYYEFRSQDSSLLHDEYGEAGLQIVTVVFNVDFDRHQELISNQNNRWIELLDPRARVASEIAKSYAIVHRSMHYLIDSHGCIVQRNPDMTDLRSYLNSYLNIPVSPEP